MILDLDKFFADSFPVVVSANLSLEEGENKQFDSELLSNYFDTPMVIDEVRVQLVSQLGELQVANFGGSIRLKLNVGRFSLTDDFVPVGCFGTTFDLSAFSGIFSPESLQGGFTVWHSTGFYRWKLPRPLLIPPGMPLEAKVSRQIEGISAVVTGEFPNVDTAVAVNLAYAGRVTKKPLPSGVVAPVPYVGLFDNVFTSADVVTSGQLDLYNPFRSTLNVQRVIARWQNIYLDSSVAYQSGISLDFLADGSGDVVDFPLTQIRTFDGFNITNGFVPGLSVWEANSKANTSNVAFEKGQGLQVTIDSTAGLPTTGAQPSPTGSNTSFVTMIGWRNENLC